MPWNLPIAIRCHDSFSSPCQKLIEPCLPDSQITQIISWSDIGTGTRKDNCVNVQVDALEFLILRSKLLFNDVQKFTTYIRKIYYSPGKQFRLWYENTLY